MKHRIRTLFRTLLISTLVLALGAAPALASGIPAWINNSSAAIYTRSGEKGSLSAGTSVDVTATKNGWAQIEYKDHVGYVKVKYLTAKHGVAAFVKKSAYVYKSASKSAKKVGPLGVGTKLTVVGFDGDFCQVTNGHALGYIPRSALSKTKPSDVTILASKVQLVEWSKGKNLLSKGSYAYLYDIQSGETIRVYRLGGSNHMEMEPATAEDTAKLLAACGGNFSWDSRPVILNAGGTLVAAAINTMPHGAQSITNNNYDGQFCLHLPGSKTHGSDSVNTNHQAAIKYAYAWAQSKVE